MKNLTRSALNVFAILENFKDGSSDILDSLAPFFEPILQQHRGELFVPEEFAMQVQNAYKWNFLPDIAEEFIPRFISRGWLQAANPNRPAGPYTISVGERALTKAETKIAAELNDLAVKLKGFSESLSPLTALNQDVGRYQDMLVEWLLYADAYSDANTEVVVRAAQDESGKIVQKVSIPRATSLSDDEIYLCARFIDYSIRQDEEVAKTLYSIASIGLLTEVVQDFLRPTSAVAKSNLVVYLDAPLAMELIGVSGQAAHENIVPIVTGLKEIGVSFRIFSTSIDEISRNLEAVLSSPNRTGPTARALGQGSVLEEYVQRVARNPASALKEYDVHVAHRTLDQFPNEIVFFDDERYKDLYNGLTFHHMNPTAREHDATIATHILRMRKDHFASDIFQSKFVLVTGNGVFAQQSRRACIRLEAISTNSIPPVVHRRVLATAAWLRTGLSSDFDKIPRHHLMASCERVLALRPSVVKAVKRFAENLDESKAKQLNILLAQDRSSQMLMDKTLGVSAVVSAENVDDLFEEMLSPYLADKQQEFDEKIQEAKEEGNRKISFQREKVKEAQKEAKQVEDLLSARQEEDLEAIRSLCNDVSDRLKKEVTIKKYICVAISIILAFGMFGSLGPSFITWFVVVLSALVTYLSVTGSTILQTKLTPEICIEKLTLAAEQRSLATKLKRFDISWNDNTFTVHPKEMSKDQLDLK